MYKIKPGYALRKVLNVYLVTGEGSAAYMPNCIMSVNEVGVDLWNLMKDGAEKADMVHFLLENYEVDEPTARKDVDTFLRQLSEKELIEAC